MARSIVGGPLIAGGFAISTGVGRLPASAYRGVGDFLRAFRTHWDGLAAGRWSLKLGPKARGDQPEIDAATRKRALTAARLLLELPPQ
jgi:hypothetical protein